MCNLSVLIETVKVNLLSFFFEFSYSKCDLKKGSKVKFSLSAKCKM